MWTQAKQMGLVLALKCDRPCGLMANCSRAVSHSTYRGQPPSEGHMHVNGMWLGLSLLHQMPCWKLLIHPLQASFQGKCVGAREERTWCNEHHIKY